MTNRIIFLTLSVAFNSVLVAPSMADSLSTSEPHGGRVEAAAPAALEEGLATLQKRIEVLKQGGTGVAPFQQIYDQIAELGKSGKADEASKLMSSLGSKLSTLESLRDQARRTSAARSVKGQQSVSAAALSTRPGAGSVDSQSTQQNMDIANLSPRPGESALSNNVRQRVFCVRQQALQLEGKYGIPAGAFRARINAAEQLSATAPWKALTDMTEIECDMNKAAEGKPAK